MTKIKNIKKECTQTKLTQTNRENIRNEENAGLNALWAEAPWSILSRRCLVLQKPSHAHKTSHMGVFPQHPFPQQSNGSISEGKGAHMKPKSPEESIFDQPCEARGITN